MISIKVAGVDPLNEKDIPVVPLTANDLIEKQYRAKLVNQEREKVYRPDKMFLIWFPASPPLPLRVAPKPEGGSENLIDRITGFFGKASKDGDSPSSGADS